MDSPPQSPAETQDLQEPTCTSTHKPTPTPTAMTTPPADPNISIRTFIYFLPHPLPPATPVPYTPGLPHRNPLNLPAHAFEPTSTVVVTSPGKTFVDLRYLKPRDPASASAAPAGAAGGGGGGGEGVDALEWGFSGSSASVRAPHPHPTYGDYTLNTWTHWVDSRVSVGEDMAPDEGAMYAVGGQAGYVEHGFAFHPQLGRVAGHEEGWVDVEPRGTRWGWSRGGSEDESGRAKGEEGARQDEGEKVCIVLRCHDDERRVRGVVVRVGQYVQGIVMVGGRVATERWEFDFQGEPRPGVQDVPAQQNSQAGDEEGKGMNASAGWKRTARTGEWFLPCAVTWQTERVQLGGRVRYGEFEWAVEEVWVWE
ncbi:hypothetical protein SVAN01_00452 [Stagonosporopsis vannaccii]|nr:hypothetical protein SVAN01_00452 [Stagonosporopsis vannaccii]